jgi:TetR/AcrR family transcriptional regulator
MPRPSRKNLILETLAHELENKPGDRITTAGLAKAVGVSEAALYRHFPSKARMFEGLIEFAEETVFARINQILQEEQDTQARCAAITYLILGFAQKNPGITRVLLGDVLVGERERLRERVHKFFERIEVQYKQVLREVEMRKDAVLQLGAEQAASVLMAFIEGRLHQFQRSGFKQTPMANWQADQAAIQRGLFA